MSAQSSMHLHLNWANERIDAAAGLAL